MKKTESLIVIVSAAVCLFAGCGKKQQIKTIEQICVPNIDKSVAMQAAEDVLGRMHFTVDKADQEQGYIKSRPLPSGQFFEFWRKDNVGGFNKAESNLHTIRKTVEITMSQQAKKLCVRCDVKTERLSLSDHKIHTNKQKYDKSSRIQTSVEKLRLTSKQKSWIDLGKDDKLSTVILKQIQKKLTKQNGREKKQ